MRSMFISLIVFCSLTQFAIAQPPPLEILKKRTFLKGCGGDTIATEKIYQCYVPEICTVEDKANGPITAGAVAKVTDETLVSADCPALIKFYQYTKNRAYVSIESFKEITEIDAITFSSKYIERVGNEEIVKTRTEFSCKSENTAEAAQNPPIMKQRGRHLQSLRYEEDDPEPGKEPAKMLNCRFEVKMKSDQNIFAEERKDKAGFKTCKLTQCLDTDSQSLNVYHKLANSEKCDPYKIFFNKIDNIDGLMLEKVQFTPEKIYCKETAGIQYQMQHRKPGATLHEAANIICNANTFNVNGFDVAGEVDARCFAEVKYLCKYDLVITGGQTGPSRTPGNRDAGAGSKMECQGDKKYLNIVYSPTHTKTIFDPKFKCTYFGGNKPYWTVSEGETGSKMTLTETGPEVYCTDKVECVKNFMLSESSVERGSLDNKFLPVCAERGTLFVKDGKEVNETSLWCDEFTGNFMYADADGEHKINNETRFECKYPRDEGKAKERVKQLKTTVIVSTVVVGVVFSALILAAFFAYSSRKVKREKERRRKQAAQNEADYIKYCGTKLERFNYYNKKKKEKQQEMAKNNKKSKNKKDEKESEESGAPSSAVISDGEPVQLWKWNNMIMYWQSNFMSFFEKDQTGQRVTERVKKYRDLPPKLDQQTLREEYGPDQNDEPPTSEVIDFISPETVKDYKNWMSDGLEKGAEERDAMKAHEDEKKAWVEKQNLKNKKTQ